MKYIFQAGIIAAVSFAAELFHVLLPLPVPASVYGLVLLFVLLMTGAVKLSQIEETADFLLAAMPVFFIEPSVKLMTSFGIIQGSVAKLLVMCVVSTVVVMLVTGALSQALIRRRKGKEQREDE